VKRGASANESVQRIDAGGLLGVAQFYKRRQSARDLDSRRTHLSPKR
jgi:hypothetical protein